MSDYLLLGDQGSTMSEDKYHVDCPISSEERRKALLSKNRCGQWVIQDDITRDVLPSALCCWHLGMLETDAGRKIKIVTISDLRKEWQSRSEEHTEKQKLNPFSDDFDHQHAMDIRLRKGDEGYGRPEKGSKTEARGKRALNHIHKEIEEMCLIIRDMGVRGRDGKIRVTFGRLFEQYVRISDKVVGILLRARKHGRLDFDGEMLWQGVHDNVIITLL